MTEQQLDPLESRDTMTDESAVPDRAPGARSAALAVVLAAAVAAFGAFVLPRAGDTASDQTAASGDRYAFLVVDAPTDDSRGGCNGFDTPSTYTSRA